MSGRILQVFNRYLKAGGEEASVERIGRHLEEGGYEREPCFFSSAEWTGESAPPKIKQVQWMWRNPAALARLREAHQRVRPDAWVVHNVYPVASAAVFEEAGKLGVPLIYFMHNYKPFMLSGLASGRPALDRRLRNFGREILAGAWQGSRLKSAVHAAVLEGALRRGWYDQVTAWVGISEWMREACIDAGVPADKAFALRHAWDPAPAPVEDRDEGYYLFLGRLTPTKGIDTLLAAWRIIEQECGADAPRLVIAGEGELEPAVRRVSDKVEFVGAVHGEVKARWIAGCRALLAPSSWWEPLGLVTYEAYESAKPMLASRSGAFRETVVEGKTGLLYPPQDPAALAASIRQLEALPAEARRRMGRNGRAWLEREAGRDRWLAGFEQIFKYTQQKRSTPS